MTEDKSMNDAGLPDEHNANNWAADTNTRKAYLMPPLTLAWIGDGVYDLYVRARLLDIFPKQPAHQLHVYATQIVRASAQAATAREILHLLDDTEQKVFKRGRNANPSTVPKNADMGDYRTATGLETVLGFLYASGQSKRLDKLLALCEQGWEI